MSKKNSMTRREALKKMGVVAAGIGLGIGGIHATDVLRLSEKEEKQGKMKYWQSMAVHARTAIRRTC